jgi:hypothetical protein
MRGCRLKVGTDAETGPNQPVETGCYPWVRIDNPRVRVIGSLARGVTTPQANLEIGYPLLKCVCALHNRWQKRSYQQRSHVACTAR